MQPKDQPTQPDRVAARMPAEADTRHATATSQADPNNALTPSVPRNMQVIGTPILSVAVTSLPPVAPKNASASDGRFEPPSGVIEAVTWVEPRAVPGNDSDLNSVILDPKVSAEEVRHEGETRNAATVRTRTRRRGKSSDPPSKADATRRSALLLALLVGVALLVTFVSSLLRSNPETEIAESVSTEPARESGLPRVDVQAASPQPQNAIEAVASAHASAENPALLPPPASTEAAPAAPAAGGSELVSVRAGDGVSGSARSEAKASTPSAPRGVSNVDASRVTRASTRAGATSLGAPAEGKSWIKVRE